MEIEKDLEYVVRHEDGFRPRALIYAQHGKMYTVVQMQAAYGLRLGFSFLRDVEATPLSADELLELALEGETEATSVADRLIDESSPARVDRPKYMVAEDVRVRMVEEEHICAPDWERNIVEYARREGMDCLRASPQVRMMECVELHKENYRAQMRSLRFEVAERFGEHIKLHPSWFPSDGRLDGSAERKVGE
ncbi:MAG: hypothetical protein ABIH41_07395 [Nanoarchaeota archaeon]